MENKQCFAFKHNDDGIRIRSTSGGAFSAIADEIVKHGGAVYGAALDGENMTVSHIRVDTMNDIDRLRGSKYLQSRMGDIFLQVKKDLTDEKWVLFSGTPCQVAGLQRFLRKEYDNLFTCDIICHGVSSPLIWKEFVSYMQQEKGGGVINACFRDKEDYRWENCKETLSVYDTTTGETSKVSADDYAKIFYEHEAMRPACYSCLYTSVERPGDITMGDFWNVEKTHPELYDEKGVSFVMKNTDKGDILIQMLAAHGELTDAALHETRQPQLYKPVKKPSTRRWFWKTYHSKGFEAIIRNNRNPDSVINVRRKTIATLKGVAKGIALKIK